MEDFFLQTTEIAIGLIGFSGLVTLFGTQKSRELTFSDIRSIKSIVEVGLVTALAGFLPSLTNNLFSPQNQFSILNIVVSVIILIVFSQTYYEIIFFSTDLKRPILTHVILATAFLVSVLLIVNVMWWQWNLIEVYAFSILFGLFIQAVQFWVLIEYYARSVQQG